MYASKQLDEANNVNMWMNHNENENENEIAMPHRLLIESNVHDIDIEKNNPCDNSNNNMHARCINEIEL